MDLETWACPTCLSGLEETAEGLQCRSEGRVFPRRDGLPVLVRPEEEGLLADAESYATAWRRDPLAPPRGSQLDLPHVPSRYWRPKARSLADLLNILGPGNRRSVADIGAGTGWLSYRLAEAGFRCFATDISSDHEVGLGAAAVYDSTGHGFERAVASLTRWPFRSGALDVAICNASLHYLPDIRPAVVEAARALKPGGVFVVMNDPVNRDRRSAEHASRDFRERLGRAGARGSLVEGHHHLVAGDLEADLRGSFPRIRRHDPDYGFAFRATRALKAGLLRMELASFPIYVAER